MQSGFEEHGDAELEEIVFRAALIPATPWPLMPVIMWQASLLGLLACWRSLRSSCAFLSFRISPPRASGPRAPWWSSRSGALCGGQALRPSSGSRTHLRRPDHPLEKIRENAMAKRRTEVPRRLTFTKQCQVDS